MTVASSRSRTDSARVGLFWLPLGAGDNTHCVRANGRIFEALAARAQRRERCDLFHSALQVHVAGARYVVEMVPAWDVRTRGHGAVCHGPVGLRMLGRSRLFRYEVRRWRGGVIPDEDAAVDSPRWIETDAARATRLLELVSSFPTATWGRDELATGDMWNSNSLISWLLVRSGHAIDSVTPPVHGRAPGWSAGMSVAERHLARTATERTSHSLPPSARHSSLR
jgi:hypothetical protein